MANEAGFIEINEFADAKQYTVAAGTTILKGTLLKISGDNTMAASDGANVYGGVAAADKNGDDSATTIAVYTPGQGNKFDMKCGAVGVSLGAAVVLEGANTIKDAVGTDFIAGNVIGFAEEAGAAAEVVVVRS